MAACGNPRILRAERHLRRASLRRRTGAAVVLGRRAITDWTTAALPRGQNLGYGKSGRETHASWSLFAPSRGCCSRCAGVLRSPRKRQPLQHQLSSIDSTPGPAFSLVAKRAVKGNKRQPVFMADRRPGVAGDDVARTVERVAQGGNSASIQNSIRSAPSTHCCWQTKRTLSRLRRQADGGRPSSGLICGKCTSRSSSMSWLTVDASKIGLRRLEINGSARARRWTLRMAAEQGRAANC